MPDDPTRDELRGVLNGFLVSRGGALYANDNEALDALVEVLMAGAPEEEPPPADPPGDPQP